MTELLNFIKDTKFEDIKPLLEPLKITCKTRGDLYMLNFQDDADFSNKLVRQANGIILEKDTNKLIHYSFEKCYDSLDGTTDDIFSSKDLGVFTVEHYFEGSMIKMYYYNGDWKVSTSKKIDAENNFWSSKKSFLTLFKEGIKMSHDISFEEFCENLDKNKSYSYILQHPEIITVVKIEVPQIFCLNEVNNETLEEVRPESQFLEAISVKENQNYMIFQKEGNSFIRIKKLSKEFIEIKDILQNYNDIGLSYLHSLKDKDSMCKFNKYYGYRDLQLYNKLDILLNTTSQEIYSLYVKKYILKKQVEIPKRYVKTIFQIHYQYKTTKTPINLEDVRAKIISLNPKTIKYVTNYKK